MWVKKLLMTGPGQGKEWVLFPRDPQLGEHWEATESKAHYFLWDQSLSVLLCPLTWKWNKPQKKLFPWHWLAHKVAATLYGFKVNDLIKSWSCSIFVVSLRSLWDLTQWQMTCSPPIWKGVWGWRYNNTNFLTIYELEYKFAFRHVFGWTSLLYHPHTVHLHEF